MTSSRSSQENVLPERVPPTTTESSSSAAAARRARGLERARRLLHAAKAPAQPMPSSIRSPLSTTTNRPGASFHGHPAVESLCDVRVKQVLQRTSMAHIGPSMDT